MIVCREPVVVYDVDLIGAAVLCVFGLAAYFAVVAPWQSTRDGYQQLARQREVAVAARDQAASKLDSGHRELQQLEELIAARQEGAAGAPVTAQLLGRLSALAEGSGLELRQVKPLPPTDVGPYRCMDVQMSARGSSPRFLRFLDRLAQECPNQSLLQYSITHASAESEGECNLEWTLRLFSAAATVSAGSPKPGASEVLSK